jgi:hypothetical protein
MNTMIADELKVIPRGKLPQNLFRSDYQQGRLNALGSNPEMGPLPADERAVALQVVRASYPDFTPVVWGED